MSSFTVLLLLVLFLEESYQVDPQLYKRTTEEPNNDWDNIHGTNLTSFMKIYAHGNKRYYISNEFKATYIEAVMFCEEINMKLVSIEDSDENDLLYKHIRDAKFAEFKEDLPKRGFCFLRCNKSPDRGDTFWTSGSKLLDGHHWVWMTEFDFVSYTNWKKGEPGNINEHCIALTHVKGSGLLWNDWDCNSKLYFVCEKDLSRPRQSTRSTGVIDNENNNRGNRIFQDSYVSPNVALLHFGNKSYFVGRHMKATYVEALRLCTMINMQLVSINSNEENNALRKYIRDTNAGDKFWSSGSRLLDGKTWVWVSNTQPVYYTNWGTNEPDNPNHLCIQLDNQKNDGLFWNDYDCSTRNYYICEKSRHIYQKPKTTTAAYWDVIKSQGKYTDDDILLDV